MIAAIACLVSPTSRTAILSLPIEILLKFCLPHCTVSSGESSIDARQAGQFTGNHGSSAISSLCKSELAMGCRRIFGCNRMGSPWGKWQAPRFAVHLGAQARFAAANRIGVTMETFGRPGVRTSVHPSSRLVTDFPDCPSSPNAAPTLARTSPVPGNYCVTAAANTKWVVAAKTISELDASKPSLD